MSYIQIEIGGQQRGLKFNKMAQLELADKIVEGNFMSGIYALIYAGMKANCYVKQVEPDFTFEQVCDWCDVLPDEVLTAVNDVFIQTEQYKQAQLYLAELELAKKKENISPKRRRNTAQKA